MTTHEQLTTDQAKLLLDTADAASATGESVGEKAWIGPALSIFLGVLVGLFLLAGVYVLPVASGPVALAVSVAYAVGVLLSVTIFNLYRRATPAGWIKRYQRGLFITMAVFFVALAMSFLIDERSPFLWVPLAIATALPLSIIGSTKATR